MKAFFSIVLIVAIAICVYMKTQKNHSMYAGVDFTALLENSPDDRFGDTLQRLLNDCARSDNLQATYSLGNFLFSLGHHAEAASIFAFLLHKDAHSYPATAGLALSLDQLGYLEQAISYYQSSLRLSNSEAERIENTHRIGELYLRLNQIEQAKATFLKLNYAPSLVDLCRIYVHEKNWDASLAVFKKLVRSDPENKSLEVYQLNVLAKRHFAKYFSLIPESNQRTLIYSQNIQLALQKKLTQEIFSYSGGEMYQNQIASLPLYSQDQTDPSDQSFYDDFTNQVLAVEGKQLYANNNCVICHGQEAQGATGPNLRDDHWIITLSPLNIFKSIKYGRSQNTMPAFRQELSNSQIRALTMYILQLNNKGPVPPNSKEPQGTEQVLNR